MKERNTKRQKETEVEKKLLGGRDEVETEVMGETGMEIGVECWGKEDWQRVKKGMKV